MSRRPALHVLLARAGALGDLLLLRRAIAASLDPRGRIRVLVRDDASPVRKLELSTDAGRWEEVHPADGIADSLEESYEIPLPAAPSPGPRIVVLRATDSLGNVATARVDVP